jgi:DNA/RNA-binding domain of Phe-tRNA-synthetase-like protein
MKLDISDISNDFPAFRVAVIVAETLQVAAERPEGLAAEIAMREAQARETWHGYELSQVPGIAVWRQAYKQFGIKKTSYRCSVERLVKNALADRSLPQINSFVDAYNAVSLRHVLPAGADNLDKVAGDLEFRYARDGDSFVPLGRADGGEDPPKAGEVVYADGEKVLCRRWNWYQDHRSPVAPETSRAVLTIQSNGHGDLEAAVADAVSLIEVWCNGTCRVRYADASAPVTAI